MTIPKLEAVLPLMKIKPVACELEIHPCFQQQELYDYLVAHDIQPVGYMPIGSPHETGEGYVSGRYSRSADSGYAGDCEGS